MPWRRDFADPLYVRHVIEDSGLEVFHMNIAKVCTDTRIMHMHMCMHTHTHMHMHMHMP